MIEEIRLPELGENIESATVGAVLVAPGDRVQAEQALMEVETEKATAELPAPVGGVIKEIRVRRGQQIAVGEVVCTLEAEAVAARQQPEGAARAEVPPRPQREAAAGAAREERPPREVPAVAKPGARAPAVPAPRPARAGPVEAVAAGVPPEVHVPAAPAARRLARELGVDITEVRGGGPGGRIGIADVKRAARELVMAGPAPSAKRAAPLPDFSQWGEIRREPMSSVRRATAANVARAWQQVAHVTQLDRADITALDRERRVWGERVQSAGGKLTITAIVLKVVAAALRRFPRFNASLDLERQEIVFKEYVHIGVAVDTERGLLVPVIRDADRKNITRIAVELTELSQRARGAKLDLAAMRGASFSVTNLGGLGTTYFTPIVAWPEVAILGVGRAALEPVWAEGAFAPRLIMPLSLSYDHRIIDGADAARFLRWVAEALEQPFMLLMEGT